jgi:Domain of unknown function (DUF3127)
MKTILNGVITEIYPSEIYGSFEKRVFHLQQSDVEKYPQTWALECQQGDCNMLDKFKTGQVVSCHIEIRGKAWAKNGRAGVINTLKCTKIDRVGQAAPAKDAAAPPVNNDDLPF